MTHVVELEPAEWQEVITALAMKNTVLVKISSQLAQQQARDRDTEVQDRRQAFMHPGNAADPNAMDIRGEPVGRSRGDGIVNRLVKEQ